MIHNVSRKRVVATVAIIALALLGGTLTSLALAACVFAILAVLAGDETRHRLSTASSR